MLSMYARKAVSNVGSWVGHWLGPWMGLDGDACKPAEQPVTVKPYDGTKKKETKNKRNKTLSARNNPSMIALFASSVWLLRGNA